MASPIRMSGMVSGLDTESIVKAMTSGYQTKVDKYKKAQTKLSWKQDAWKKVNTKVNDFYNKLDKFRYSSGWNLQKVTASDATKVSVSSSGSAFNGTQTLEVSQLASAASLTGGKLDNATASTKISDLVGGGFKAGSLTLHTGTGNATSDDLQIKIDANTTISDVVNQLKINGLNASFDENQKRFYISSKKSGSDSDFTLTNTDSANDLLSALRLDTTATDTNKKATKHDGSDAIIKLDDIEYTSASNNFSINGLNIQALAQTSGKITLNTQIDTQGIYDKVKDFISSYNDLINDLADRYNAESSGSYEPLTDDEKAELSDTEVEKWEKKIKTGLLRRDDTLDSIMNSLTNTMLGTYYDDSVATRDATTGKQVLNAGVSSAKKYSLASFGIMTMGILKSSANRQYEYHIDGDEDDSAVSAKTDKLMAAITQDPDKVVNLIKNVANDLSSNLKKQMSATSMRSVFTVYNDKEMASEYSSYTTLINQWTTRLNDLQDSYYKKFSKMESTLSKLQSTTSSLGFSKS